MNRADLSAANQPIDWSKIHCAGIVGLPPRTVMARLVENRALIHDLDAEIAIEQPQHSGADLLPMVYCGILRTVVDNAMLLAGELDAIFIDIGPGKCDAARYTAQLLARTLPLPIVTCHNLDREAAGYPICRSGLPLLRKLELITAGVKKPSPPAQPPPHQPASAGFWGVPPRDFSLLELFPDTTHLYGWSRCLENKTPADHDLEAIYRPDLPTVFFAQSFCAKTALARALAAAHPNALYLDVDARGGQSARAKIEAFLQLNGAI